MTRGIETVSLTVKLWLVASVAAVALGGCSGTTHLVRHGSPARIQRQQGGFTLTEHVHVGAGVRTEFNDSVKLLDAHRYQQGIALLLKVAKTAPNLTAARVNLGIAYERVGQLDGAEKSLKRALALDPRQVVAYNELGMVLRREGRFAEARASYEKALALAPDFYYARLNLGILCDLYLTDPKCALDNYLAYQKLMPDDKQVAVWIRDLHGQGEH